MPQLMPLMWMYSIMMCLLLMFVMMIMYSYKNELELYVIENVKEYNIMYMW